MDNTNLCYLFPNSNINTNPNSDYNPNHNPTYWHVVFTFMTSHTNYRELLTKTDNYWQFTHNYRQILFTDNRQEILKHSDRIPTSSICWQIPTTRWTNTDCSNWRYTDKYYLPTTDKKFWQNSTKYRKWQQETTKLVTNIREQNLQIKARHKIVTVKTRPQRKTVYMHLNITINGCFASDSAEIRHPVCQIPLTVQHFMLDCTQFTVKRAKCLAVSSLKNLFRHVNAHVIVDFIKDIGFYYHFWYHTSPPLTLVFLIYILL